LFREQCVSNLYAIVNVPFFPFLLGGCWLCWHSSTFYRIALNRQHPNLFFRFQNERTSSIMTVIHKPPQRDNILITILVFVLAGTIVAYAVLSNHPQWWASLGVGALLIAVGLPRMTRLLRPIDIHLTPTSFERHQGDKLVSRIEYSDMIAIRMGKRIATSRGGSSYLWHRIPVPVVILESRSAEPVKLDVYRTNEYKVRPILMDLLPRLPDSVVVAQNVQAYAQTGELPDVNQLPDVEYMSFST
jgi:hypothetical protein